MEHSRFLKLALGVFAVAFGVLTSSEAWALEPACVPGHHTVVPPCAFDGGVLSIDSATGPNGTDVFTGGGGGGHHTLVTFPVDPTLGPGIQVAADIAGGHPAYMATDSPTGTSSGSMTFTISTVSGLPLIKDLSIALLNPIVTGTGSISWSLGSLTGNQTISSGELVFAPPLSSITLTLTGSLIAGTSGNASIDGFVINVSLASVCSNANPALGAATACTILQSGSPNPAKPFKIDITGPAGGILGNICIGAHSSLTASGSNFVSGSIFLDPDPPAATCTSSAPGVNCAGATVPDLDTQ